MAIEACREAWHVHDELTEWGHQVLVVDTTRVRQLGIGQHQRKNDRIDAEVLARAVERGGIPLAHVLSPQRRQMRHELSIRRALVETRAQYVTTIRGILRAQGIRLPTCEVEHFGDKLAGAKLDEDQRELAKPFALAIMVAWTVMFSRVVVEVAALNVALLNVLWLPMTASALAGLAYCVFLYLSQRTDRQEDIQVSNPFELGPAIKFGLLYALILLASRAAQLYLGNAGLYLSSILSGLADVDAITLSVAELTRTGSVDLSTGARAIVLATMSNTVIKGGIVLTAGAGPLRRALLPGLALMLIAGLGVVFLV